MSPSARIIIDTDPGVDDAIAILMALACPDLDILGLTVVGGNVSRARGTRNALALLEYAGWHDIPVFRGAARPLEGRFPYSHYFHGQSGLSRRLPRPQMTPADATAVSFLLDQLQEHPGQVTIVALGPLTNLARLLRAEPDALPKAKSVLVMGGAVNVPGNVTPYAEFNFYSDPAAASEVAASAVPFTLVDLGACRKVFITRAEAERLRSSNHLGRLVVQLLTNWFGRDPQRERFEFYDPLTLAVAIEPGLLQTRKVTLSVEAEAGDRMGESLITDENGVVSVVEEVDEGRFFELFRELLGL